MLDDTVIPLCSALAAQEHGDARKALMLLRYAGDAAVQRGGDLVTETDVREAQKWVESNKIAETIKTLPYHQNLVPSIIASFDGKTSAQTNLCTIQDAVRGGNAVKQGAFL